MRGLVSTPDQRVALVAARQHGVVTIAQLLAAGLTQDAVERRVRKGTLHRIHRGIYRVGHTAPSTEATYLAAVLACDPGAQLGGKAMGHLYRLVKGPPPPPEVIAPVDKRRPGITTRRTKLHPRDTRKYRGIPGLTVAATLIDLAATDVDLGFAVFRADAFHGVTVDAVAAAARRRGPFPGIKELRALYTGDAPILLSELERRFVSFLAENGFPTPVTNRKESAHYVDCRWPDHALTVELDSYRFHNSRKAWEQGHHREREARRRGDEFRRYTWFDVVEDQAYLLGDLGSLLPCAARLPRPRRDSSVGRAHD